MAGAARSLPVAWPQRVTVVHNPGAGDASPPADLLLGMLSQAGYHVRYTSTHEAWQEVLQEVSDLVVVVGGDGTVADVVRELAGREQVFTILPFGKANNIAKNHGIAGDAAAIVRDWPRAPIVELDVWQVERGDGSGCFVESFGGGFMGRAIHDAQMRSSTLVVGGTIDRALEHVRGALRDEPGRHWRILMDGTDHSGTYIGVEIMNTRYIGPNVALAGSADPGDGCLDLVLVRPNDRRALARALDPADAGIVATRLPLHSIRGREVEVEPPAGVALHLDDEPWRDGHAAGELHVTLASRARLLVPR